MVPANRRHLVFWGRFEGRPVCLCPLEGCEILHSVDFTTTIIQISDVSSVAHLSTHNLKAVTSRISIHDKKVAVWPSSASTVVVVGSDNSNVT